MKNHDALVNMMLSAMFAAILCICSPLTIPIGPVPLSLVIFAVMLCGVVLDLSTALLSVTVFLLLGLFLPVFAGGRTGVAALTGVTGGYIWSFLLMVPVIRGLAGTPTAKKILRYPLTLLGCVLSVALCYILGTTQFVLVAGDSVRHALEVCVIPFILPDLAKALAATVLGIALRDVLARMGYRGWRRAERNSR